MFKKIIIILVVFACVVNVAYAFFHGPGISSECDCWYGASHGDSGGDEGCYCIKVGNGCACFADESP